MKKKFTKIGKKSLALCALKLFQFFLNLEKICIKKNTIAALYIRCGTFFCYLCGARLPAQNPYSHFSYREGECFQLLFEGADDMGDDEFEFLDDEDEED